jgi:Rab9 effector protein with kelch motifs
MTNGSNGSAQTGATSSLLNPSSASNGPTPPLPLPRRAHTAVLYRSKLYIFGGGNGVRALNDVWCLDTSVAVEKMRWEQVKTSGPRPGPRGYHTANLVANNMIVVGGSDGRECFSDIWVLNLGELGNYLMSFFF